MHSITIKILHWNSGTHFNTKTIFSGIRIHIHKDKMVVIAPLLLSWEFMLVRWHLYDETGFSMTGLTLSIWFMCPSGTRFWKFTCPNDILVNCIQKGLRSNWLSDSAKNIAKNQKELTIRKRNWINSFNSSLPIPIPIPIPFIQFLCNSNSRNWNWNWHQFQFQFRNWPQPWHVHTHTHTYI